MKTKIILTGFFFFGLLAGLQAQEQYEFAMVYRYPTKSEITIIKSNQEIQTVETNLKVTDFNGLLQQVVIQASKLTEQGWELINVADSGWYFKRKKQ